MTMEELGKTVEICFFSLGGSVFISQVLNLNKLWDLNKWLTKNKSDKWKEMRGGNYIRYVFNDEDMNVEVIKNLKNRLRIHLKFTLIIFCLLITMSLIVLFVLATGIVKGGPGWE